MDSNGESSDAPISLSRRNVLAAGGAGTMLAMLPADALGQTARPAPGTAPPPVATLQQRIGHVSLDDERANIGARGGQELFNDCGFVIRAQADTGEDILLWIFLIRQQGKEVLIDSDLNLTFFIAYGGSEESMSRMHDTPFINHGQNIEDYYKPGSLTVSEQADKVVWSLGEREIVCAPPRWLIRGEHGGVACNLELLENGLAHYQIGRFEDFLKSDLSKHASAGYAVHCTVKGEIRANGKTYRIKGHALHERLIHGGTLFSRLQLYNGEGGNYIHSFGEEFSFSAGNTDGKKTPTNGRVMIDGKHFSATGSEQAKVEVLDRWTDPKTAQTLPSAWRITLNTDGGVLDATVTSFGRVYYYQARRGGLLSIYHYMAKTDATFTYPDGRTVKSRQKAWNQYMRTYYDEAALAKDA